MDVALVLLALAAGFGLAVQAGANATMARFAGRAEWAALVNFVVGIAALGAWLVLARLRPPSAAQLAGAPWWSWSGGLLGAFYVTAIVLLAPRLGVATTMALAVAGQMGGAIVVDHFGLLGMAERAASPLRGLGALLLVAGVVLIRRF